MNRKFSVSIIFFEFINSLNKLFILLQELINSEDMFFAILYVIMLSTVTFNISNSSAFFLSRKIWFFVIFVTSILSKFTLFFMSLSVSLSILLFPSLIVIPLLFSLPFSFFISFIFSSLFSFMINFSICKGKIFCNIKSVYPCSYNSFSNCLDGFVICLTLFLPLWKTMK